jgi:hypothetical protein
MKFLIVEPSPFPILIPIEAKYLLQILLSNNLSLHSSLYLRDHFTQPYSTTGSVIILYILILKFFGRSGKSKRVWTEKIKH